ncbi:MAG: malto-oligosyltrehalose trehalohydrolase [Spirochaetia bacterium]
MRIGSHYTKDSGTTFCVWAPLRNYVEVHIVAPADLRIPMEPDDAGYWHAHDDRVFPGAEYFYRLDGHIDRPDPASRRQPRGVHGPSEVVRPADLEVFDEDYSPPELADLVMYELHTGTFTPEGTLDAAATRIPYLSDLGINAVELMPLAHFPGQRNWGYDGAYPYAVHTAYGGPAALARFVEAAHAYGIAVYLDVVYNHLGPEGSYLADFGPYFTDRYSTPWGSALNFDGPYSDHVRSFFIGNLQQWLEEFHIDGLRLDAVYAMLDIGANPILSRLSQEAERISIRTGRKRTLIAESLQNDSRIITPRAKGGFGMDAEWLDDMHHALHAKVTGERAGYYVDFGSTEQIRKAYAEAYALSYTYSHYRKRTFGNSADERSAQQFVVYTQNHDQVGNRPKGDRLSSLVDTETLKLLAGAVLLGPYTPMLFMGEEYGESSPFEYFVSHSDPDLIDAVRKGRELEFADVFERSQVPDPQSRSAFDRSKINLEQAHNTERGKRLFATYKEMIRLRHVIAAMPADEPTVHAVMGAPEDRPAWFTPADIPLRARLSVECQDDIIAVARSTAEGLVVLLLNFADEGREAHFEREETFFRVLFDSSDEAWGGPGMKNGLHVQPAEPIWLNRMSVLVLQEEW